MATLDSLDDMPADPGVQASEPSVLPPAEAPKTDDVADVWSDAAWQGWGSTWWRPGWSSWQWRENGWGSGAYWSGWQGSARSYQAADAGPSDARATGNAGSQLGGSTRATGDGGSTGEASQVDPWAAAAAAISAAAAAQDRVLPADQAQDRGAPVGRDAARLPDPAQERSGEQSGASGGWSSAWNDSWRWSGGNAKGDYSDPPPFPGWAHRRYWTAAVRRWNKNTDVPLFRRGEKVLRSLGWELQADMEHISEDELSRDTYLETILAVIDAKAGVREDDEKRRAFKAVMTENQRKREESLSQYSLRRLRDFQRAMSFGFDLPPELKAAMLREGASLSEQNMQNLAAILRQDDKNPDLVAKALCHLDVRSDRLIGYVDEARPADEPGASTFVSEEVEEGEDEELSDDEVIAELGALDLYEDQICEVFAVLDGNGAFKKRRSWKENRIMKAEMRKDRGSFIKGSDAPPKGHGGGLPGGRDVGRGRDHRGGGRGRGSMTREQLKKISRCRGCGQKGHWVAECPNKGAPSGFVYMPEQPQASSIAFSFLTRQEILAAALEVRAARPTNLTDEAAWSYLTMPSGDAIIDTGATQDLIGTVAFRALSHRLAEVGLKAVKIDVPCAVPSGIGGKATVEQVVLVPISPGGCSGVLQMVVLATDIPPLLSIGFMDFMGTVIDLPAKEVRFTKHRCTLPLNELPSGHRSIPLVEWPGGKFEVPAQLREKFGLSENAFDLKQGSFLQYIKETVPREHAGCERSVSTSIIPEEAPVHFPSKSQTVRFESVTGSCQCAVRLHPPPRDFSGMDRAAALSPPVKCWRAVVSRMLIILESSRLMYFKLALAERAKKSRQGRLKYVASEESAAGACLHPANRILRRGNQWASWQICTQCQARVAYSSKPRAKSKAKAKAAPRPVEEEVAETMTSTPSATTFRPPRRGPSAASSSQDAPMVNNELQNMMQTFLLGVQQQNASMSRAMDQINQSLRDLARGQSQMLMMAGETETGFGQSPNLQQQAEQLAKAAMEVDLEDEWDEVNPNAVDIGSP
ncbi:hypothetical protein AK812_SmicGene35647 [Symbiodinium microadriaticum]|uniref:CCHC-type domain-containing protein n=1 Tax=Symbiodinium microadriaticum TaxID=2951 RepID=A0A1Q9CKV7_SYMMI|nr:hypothetical protein AK812_SmicGene35647 [Symbiodinium microadriaticum]